MARPGFAAPAAAAVVVVAEQMLLRLREIEGSFSCSLHSVEREMLTLLVAVSSADLPVELELGFLGDANKI